MADNGTHILSAIATVSSKLPDLSIKNGQLIFVKDTQKIALDYNDKRTFYNQIIILQTDQERTSILAPVSEQFYFVIETAVLWNYQTEWIQITTSPQDIIFIGVTLPEFGSEKTIYVNKQEKNISIYDSELNEYIVVSDTTESIADDDISSLFE